MPNSFGYGGEVNPGVFSGLGIAEGTEALPAWAVALQPEVRDEFVPVEMCARGIPGCVCEITRFANGRPAHLVSATTAGQIAISEMALRRNDDLVGKFCGNCRGTLLPTCQLCGRCQIDGATRRDVLLAAAYTGRWNKYLSLVPSWDSFGAEEACPSRMHGLIDCCKCRTCSACGIKVPADSPDRAFCDFNHHIDCGQCSCWKCTVCGDMWAVAPETIKTCANCSKIVACCCSCQSCEECGASMKVAHICERCSRCPRTCCTCIPDPREGSKPVKFARPFFQSVPLTFHPGVTHLTNPLRRFTGIELEIAEGGTEWTNLVVVRKWGGAIVADGSLPHNTGFEINMAPASGDALVRQISDIAAELNGQRGPARTTDKCGMHVHVDTSDYNIWDLRRFITLYDKIEPALFSLLPAFRLSDASDIRRPNHFCLPCGQFWLDKINAVDQDGKKHPRTNLLQTLYPDRMWRTPGKKRGSYFGRWLKLSKSGKDNETRYNALNVHSFYLRKTLEFRHAPSSWTRFGQVSADDITCWAMLVTSLVDRCAKMSDAEVEAMRMSMATLYSLSPTEKVSTWMRIKQTAMQSAIDCTVPLPRP